MRIPIVTATLVLSALSLWSHAADRRVVLVPTDDNAGLKAIVEKWKSDELQRQGGKFESHGWWPWGLIAFDFDNDGDIDLVAQQHGKPQSIVIKNQLKETGELTFVNANAELGLPTNGLAGCFTPLAWDFDGDGFVDLAYCDALPNTCFFNKAGKGFEPMGFVFGQLEGIRFVGDVNGDGYLDVYHDLAQYPFDPATRKFLRPRNGQAPHEHPLHARPPEAIAAFVDEMKKDPKFVPRYLKFQEGIDFIGDGKRGLAYGYFGSYGTGPIWGRYLAANAAGKWTDITGPSGLPETGTPILFRDLNGDGIDDVLIAAAGLYLSDGPGHFVLKPGPVTNFLNVRQSYIHEAFAVDLANSGRFDLVMHDGRGQRAKVFENRGNGDFEEIVSQETWIDSVAICDINNDGLMDVVIAGPKDSITVHLNQTAQPGNGCLIFPRMEKPNPYAVGATIEVFNAGDLAKKGARPLASDRAHPDGTPIHFGLGDATTIDLKTTFPGSPPKVVKLENVAAGRRLTITVDGKIEELK